MSQVFLAVIAGVAAVFAMSLSMYASWLGGPKRFIHLGVAITMMFFMVVVFEVLSHPTNPVASKWFSHVLIALFCLIGANAYVEVKEKER